MQEGKKLVHVKKYPLAKETYTKVYDQLKAKDQVRILHLGLKKHTYPETTPSLSKLNMQMAIITSLYLMLHLLSQVRQCSGVPSLLAVPLDRWQPWQ